MDTNDDFYGKELNLNCFYMHTNFEQKYPKTAIVNGRDQVALELFPIRNQMAPEMFPEIVYGCLLDKARFCPLIGN